MSTINDKKILDFKKDIEEKELKLNTFKKADLFTNCNFIFEGERYNLQTMQREPLISIMIKLNIYLLSAKDLGIKDYKISGFKIEEWIADMKSLLENIDIRDEKLKLKKLKDKLNNLLSDDKKVELELEDIESQLNS